jgi:hypothetical protein
MHPLTQQIMALIQDTSLTLPDLAVKIDALLGEPFKLTTTQRVYINQIGKQGTWIGTLDGWCGQMVQSWHDRKVKRLQAALRVARGYVEYITENVKGNNEQGMRDLKTIDNALEG